MGTQSPSPKRGRSPILGPCLLRSNSCIDQDATWYGGRPRPIRHCVRWEPISPSPKGDGAPSTIFGLCLLWPNGWMDQDGTWRGDASWSRPHCARWGPSSPPQKGTERPPIFSPSLLWLNDWMHQDTTWYGGRPQREGLCVRWGRSPHSPKRGRSSLPPFSAHFYCDQTAECIKMPLGMEVGRFPRQATLCYMVTQLSPHGKGHSSRPTFWPTSIVPNGWMDQDTTWYAGRPKPRRHCVRW